MIKVSDFIFQHLVEMHGIRHCFLVTGGGAMHLNDSVGHTQGLTYICNHHEQASAIAAETGVLGQYLDSIPGIYISGQIKTSTYKHTYDYLNLRQLGDQEADIVSMVTPITKYAKTIYNPLDIKYELDKAIAIALDGRPGPVWLDIPLDVQGAMVDETKFKEFDAATEMIDPVKHTLVDEQIKQLKEGKAQGVDIKIYANPALSAEQMKWLKFGLTKGADVRCIAFPEFKLEAMQYYVCELIDGMDIKKYLNTEYNAEQIAELSLAVEEGLDISNMANPKNSASDMAEIRERLEYNIWNDMLVTKDGSWK